MATPLLLLRGPFCLPSIEVDVAIGRLAHLPLGLAAVLGLLWGPGAPPSGEAGVAIVWRGGHAFTSLSDLRATPQLLRFGPSILLAVVALEELILELLTTCQSWSVFATPLLLAGLPVTLHSMSALVVFFAVFGAPHLMHQAAPGLLARRPAILPVRCPSLAIVGVARGGRPLCFAVVVTVVVAGRGRATRGGEVARSAVVALLEDLGVGPSTLAGGGGV
mmetsp:Transcript_144653/g.376430  ORF Transcript_144653/g.376430 Transcript_144653/m.376430 type:complete len:220 (-) Transcript_144653:1030-1689(-)